MDGLVVNYLVIPPAYQGSSYPFENTMLEYDAKSYPTFLPPKKSKAQSYFGVIP
jgi:hypothetical protein